MTMSQVLKEKTMATIQVDETSGTDIVQMPNAEELARIKDAIKQRDAIFALGGFEPTDQTRAIDAAVLAGRVTCSQVIKETVAGRCLRMRKPFSNQASSGSKTMLKAPGRVRHAPGRSMCA
jgi:hypothetical protein